MRACQTVASSGGRGSSVRFHWPGAPMFLASPWPKLAACRFGSFNFQFQFLVQLPNLHWTSNGQSMHPTVGWAVAAPCFGKKKHGQEPKPAAWMHHSKLRCLCTGNAHGSHGGCPMHLQHFGPFALCTDARHQGRVRPPYWTQYARAIRFRHSLAGVLMCLLSLLSHTATLHCNSNSQASPR